VLVKTLLWILFSNKYSPWQNCTIITVNIWSHIVIIPLSMSVCYFDTCAAVFLDNTNFPRNGSAQFSCKDNAHVFQNRPSRWYFLGQVMDGWNFESRIIWRRRRRRQVKTTFFEFSSRWRFDLCGERSMNVKLFFNPLRTHCFNCLVTPLMRVWGCWIIFDPVKIMTRIIIRDLLNEILSCTFLSICIDKDLYGRKEGKLEWSSNNNYSKIGSGEINSLVS